MMDKVSDDLDVQMNYTNAQDHVPEAERNNRTIKERVRSAYHRLPFRKLPKTMIKYLAMVQVNHLNLFPAKGGVSKYYSPRMILTERNLEYEKHCKVPFGAYVQATHETNATNSIAARTLDCIYLRANNNIQGGHEVMDLNTGRVITRSRVKMLPMTEVVIKAVEAMAEKQGQKDHKFQDLQGVQFLDLEKPFVADDTSDTEKEAYHLGMMGEGPGKDEFSLENDEFYEEIDDEELEGLFADQQQPLYVESLPEVENFENEMPENHEICELQGINEENQEQSNNQEAEVVTDQETSSQGSELRRSSRQRTEVQRLEPTMRGQSYLEGHGPRSILRKKINFQEDKIKKKEMSHNIIHQVKPPEECILEYDMAESMVITRLIGDLRHNIATKGASFAQQFILQKGLKAFGEKGHEAAKKELEQLHKRNCFHPVSIKEMTAVEKKKSQQSLMFLSEKKNGNIKGRMVYDGKPTRE